MYNSIPYTWKTPRISQPVPKNCECGSLGRQTVVNAIHKHKQRPRNTHEWSQSSLSLTADADSLTNTTSNLPVNTHTHTNYLIFNIFSYANMCWAEHGRPIELWPNYSSIMTLQSNTNLGRDRTHQREILYSFVSNIHWKHTNICIKNNQQYLHKYTNFATYTNTINNYKLWIKGLIDLLIDHWTHCSQNFWFLCDMWCLLECVCWVLLNESVC